MFRLRLSATPGTAAAGLLLLAVPVVPEIGTPTTVEVTRYLTEAVAVDRRPGRGAEPRSGPACAGFEVTGVRKSRASSRLEDGQRHRILVVDDNIDAATSLAALLETQGHEVAPGDLERLLDAVVRR